MILCNHTLKEGTADQSRMRMRHLLKKYAQEAYSRDHVSMEDTMSTGLLRRNKALPSCPILVPSNMSSQLLGADLLGAGTPGVRGRLAGSFYNVVQRVSVAVGTLRRRWCRDVHAAHEVVTACCKGTGATGLVFSSGHLAEPITVDQAAPSSGKQC